MGVFKSYRELTKQAKEIQKNSPPVGKRMAMASERMAEAQEMMAAQTQAANLAATGIPATATINAVRQGSSMINFQPVLELDLIVLAPGRPPVPVTLAQVVPQVYLGKAQPGAQVAVKVDPADVNTVWIDWASPVAA
ncbi:MAG: hypothetical protein AAGC46_14685 [Solirubrobacteraceae bacterium]|nr:hypothetical protein [Patulibacter sp.]